MSERNDARKSVKALIISKTAIYKHQWLDLYSKADWDVPEQLRKATGESKVVIQEKVLAGG